MDRGATSYADLSRRAHRHRVCHERICGEGSDRSSARSAASSATSPWLRGAVADCRAGDDQTGSTDADTSFTSTAASDVFSSGGRSRGFSDVNKLRRPRDGTSDAHQLRPQELRQDGRSLSPVRKTTDDNIGRGSDHMHQRVEDLAAAVEVSSALVGAALASMWSELRRDSVRARIEPRSALRSACRTGKR